MALASLRSLIGVGIACPKIEGKFIGLKKVVELNLLRYLNRWLIIN